MFAGCTRVLSVIENIGKGLDKGYMPIILPCIGYNIFIFSSTTNSYRQKLFIMSQGSTSVHFLVTSNLKHFHTLFLLNLLLILESNCPSIIRISFDPPHLIYPNSSIHHAVTKSPTHHPVSHLIIGGASAKNRPQ